MVPLLKRMLRLRLACRATTGSESRKFAVKSAWRKRCAAFQKRNRRCPKVPWSEKVKSSAVVAAWLLLGGWRREGKQCRGTGKLDLLPLQSPDASDPPQSSHRCLCKFFTL